MKVAFILLALGNLAHAATRISQISPATGYLDGEPIAWDIDQDGDANLILEINGDTYIYEKVESGNFSATSIKLEMANRPLSQSKETSKKFRWKFPAPTVENSIASQPLTTHAAK